MINNAGMKEISDTFKSQKDKKKLIQVITFLSDSKMFKDEKGKDLIFGLTEFVSSKNKKMED